MKKILFFIPTLGGGGAEKVLVNLVNNLDDNKYDITVQTLFDYGINKKNLKQNIKYKYIFKKIFRGNKHLFKLFSPQFLYKMMISESYDIVVSYLEGPTTRIVSGCTDKKTKLIAWVHTEMSKLNEFTSSYRSAKEMKNAYEKFDNIVFVANATMDNFYNTTNIKKKGNLVIRNIIDINDILSKANEKIDNDILKKSNVPIIITIARLAKSKGYNRLLKIHKNLIDEGIDNVLWILGEGNERKTLETYIQENNLEKSVYLLGYQENPYKFLSKSDIYVCSSYIEGYSTAVTEAVILGKPIVTTRCSGMEEILDNGRYGVIVENKDEELYKGIKNILLDKSLLNKYKKLSLERSKYFSLDNQIRQVEKLFDKKEK